MQRRFRPSVFLLMRVEGQGSCRKCFFLWMRVAGVCEGNITGEVR